MAVGTDSGQAVAVPLPAHGPAVLELHLGELRQLFNSMDPAPFRQRDLDPKASDYIVDWAAEAPADQALAMVVHLGTPTPDTAMAGDAVREYFRGRAVAKRRELSKLFRVGRISLVIGLAFLAVAIGAGEALAGLISEKGYAWLVKESMVIGGWVALWRPLEIFLYDWWPLRAQAKLYDRLGRMPVSVA
jgi:hypothetical protein